jgi:hypothetical protein
LTPNICPFAVNAAPRTLWWNEGAPTPLVPILASDRNAGEGLTKFTTHTPMFTANFIHPCTQFSSHCAVHFFQLHYWIANDVVSHLPFCTACH